MQKGRVHSMFRQEANINSVFIRLSLARPPSSAPRSCSGSWIFRRTDADGKREIMTYYVFSPERKSDAFDLPMSRSCRGADIAIQVAACLPVAVVTRSGVGGRCKRMLRIPFAPLRGSAENWDWFNLLRRISIDGLCMTIVYFSFST